MEQPLPGKTPPEFVLFKMQKSWDSRSIIAGLKKRKLRLGFDKNATKTGRSGSENQKPQIYEKRFKANDSPIPKSNAHGRLSHPLQFRIWEKAVKDFFFLKTL